MAANVFTIEQYGLNTPCRFIYSPTDEKILEIVRFMKGLAGPATFCDGYKKTFKRQGIFIYNCQGSTALQNRIGKYIVQSDPLFGEAFYYHHVPNMIKQEPDFYRWELLQEPSARRA
jgi:hypothetical protein